MPQPYNVGIIGYRGFGAFCTTSFRRGLRATVRAFAGRDEAAMKVAATECGVPRIYTNWRDLIADTEIDIVHISTPPDSHAQMAIAALESGKHVIIEKPLALTNADCAAVLKAASERPHLAVTINFVMRYNPLYRIVRKIRGGNFLGRLTHVNFHNFASDERLGDDHWFWKPEQSGGIFVEHGVHFFDIVGHVIGARATAVNATAWIREGIVPKEDRVQSTVTYANGTSATYYHAFNRPGLLESQSVHFAFEQGHVRLIGWNPLEMELEGVVNEAAMKELLRLVPDLETEPFESSEGVIHGNGIDYPVTCHVRTTVDLGDPEEMYRSEISALFEDFLDTIENPTEHRPRVTLLDGAEAVRVAVASAESARSGCSVRLC